MGGEDHVAVGVCFPVEGKAEDGELLVRGSHRKEVVDVVEEVVVDRSQEGGSFLGITEGGGGINREEIDKG